MSLPIDEEDTMGVNDGVTAEVWNGDLRVLGPVQLKALGASMCNSFLALSDEYLALGELPEPTYPLNPPQSSIEQKQMGQVGIAPTVTHVLCGTVMGDSSMSRNKGYAHARIQCRHSTRQSDWFFWKWFVVCTKYINGLSSLVLKAPDGYQADSPRQDGEQLGKLKIVTLSKDGPLDRLYNLLCPPEGNPERYKKIERSWLNHMSNYFLMTLWLDDGSLTGGYQGQISMENFSREQQEIFVRYMFIAWGVKMVLREIAEDSAKEAQRIAAGKPRSVRPHFATQDDLKKFILIIAPVIPVSSMLYKILYVPSTVTNPGLQRWATDLSEAVHPKFKNKVLAFYANILN